MNAELKRQFASLNPGEKEVAHYFAMPDVGPDGDGKISAELKAELERRIRESDKHPENAMSLEDFKLRWAH